MKALKLLITFISGVLFLCIVIAYSLIDQSDTKVPILKNHPNALWSGAQDGGVFFEITKKRPPNYYIQVRYENGDLWTEGWVRYESRGGVELTTQNLLGYDGGEDVYLRDETALKLDSNSSK
jgi:hypothetical protein